jgi:hypothetical protein
MRTPFRSVLAAVLLAAALPAAAQAPDSVFAVSKSGVNLFRLNVDAGAVFRGTFTGFSGGIPAEGAGTRMMWYPQKAAFRAGSIDGTQWDDANIGSHSFAAGQDVRASGDNATAFGLRTTATHLSSFAAGEDNTADGEASVAMGFHANTNLHPGTFVFSDRSSLATALAGVDNSAHWRVSRGFRIFTSSNQTTGVTIQSGAQTSNWCLITSAVISASNCAYLSVAGVWQNVSDARRKHLFLDVPGETVLDRLRTLPIRTWSYRVEPDHVRHIGPTAQDFHAAFGVGSDSTTISSIDEGGVALAGVQALDTRTIGQQARIDALERENAKLHARLDAMERLLRVQPARASAPKP